MNDHIDKAIAADPGPTLVEVRITMNATGRPIVLLVPDDLIDAEVIAIASFVLEGLRPHLAQSRSGPRLIVPGRA